MKDPRGFEKPIQELEAKIESLELFGGGQKQKRELNTLRKKLKATREEIFEKLTPWQTVQVARHPERPYTLDYVEALFSGFLELHGDRRFGDDPAIVGGLAYFRGKPVCVIGHQKGRNTKQKIYRNFGMARPEGYRKALRLMKLAEEFGLPVLTFVDTPGAYPGLDAEERGQASAIALNLREMALLETPIIVTVIGEGGSGGALALGVGDRINMLQYSIYSVISPEGCAAILWKDATKAEEAAAALKLGARDLHELGLVDEIIEEPAGGVQVNPQEVFASIGELLEKQLAEMAELPKEELVRKRYDKFRIMGTFKDPKKPKSKKS